MKTSSGISFKLFIDNPFDSTFTFISLVSQITVPLASITWALKVFSQSFSLSTSFSNIHSLFEVRSKFSVQLTVSFTLWFFTVEPETFTFASQIVNQSSGDINDISEVQVVQASDIVASSLPKIFSFSKSKIFISCFQAFVNLTQFSNFTTHWSESLKVYVESFKIIGIEASGFDWENIKTVHL